MTLATFLSAETPVSRARLWSTLAQGRVGRGFAEPVLMYEPAGLVSAVRAVSLSACRRACPP